jgi:hypothetical protein
LAWCNLDDSHIKAVQARAFLATVRVALLNPETTLNNDALVNALILLGEILDGIEDRIDRARDLVRSLDQTVDQIVRVPS